VYPSYLLDSFLTPEMLGDVLLQATFKPFKVWHDVSGLRDYWPAL
jgi:hypothetical protein